MVNEIYMHPFSAVTQVRATIEIPIFVIKKLFVLFWRPSVITEESDETGSRKHQRIITAHGLRHSAQLHKISTPRIKASCTSLNDQSSLLFQFLPAARAESSEAGIA